MKMKLSPSIKGIILGVSLNALRLNFPSLLHPHNFLFISYTDIKVVVYESSCIINMYITIERFSQLIPIVQSYWPVEIFHFITFKILFLLSTETSSTLIEKHVCLDMEFLKDLGKVAIQF